MQETPAQQESHRNLAKTIFRNTGFITIGTIALKAINFLFGIYIVRTLGDTQFGQYSIVLAFVGIFSIFAELGMSQYVMREMARDRTKIKVYFWNLVILRALLALIGMLIIPLAGRGVGYSEEIVFGLVLYTSSFILSALSIPLGSVLAADERLGVNTVVNIVGQVFFIILGSIFLYSGLSFIWLIIANLLSLVPRIVISAWTIRKLHISDLPFRLDLKLWPHIIRSGIPFGIVSLMLSIALSIDTVMLSWFTTEETVGFYNVSYNLVIAMMFFFWGFKEAIVPTLTKVYVNDPVHVEKWYYHSVKMIAIIAIPIAVGGFVIAYPLIRFLYTDEFLPSALGLQILIWDVPLLMFAGFCGNITTIIGAERSAARINTINTIANVGLNLIFIPRYGLVGAAFVTVITDLISSIQFHYLLRRKLNLPDIKTFLVRVILAAAIMAVPVHLMLDFHVFIPMIVGAIIYFILIIAFRVIGNQELEFIRKAARKLKLFWPTREL
jgi:O-antigen/teichoic acid export membrane protein